MAEIESVAETESKGLRQLMAELKAALVEEFLQVARDAVYKWSLMNRTDQSWLLGYAKELVSKLEAAIAKFGS